MDDHLLQLPVDRRKTEVLPRILSCRVEDGCLHVAGILTEDALHHQPVDSRLHLVVEGDPAAVVCGIGEPARFQLHDLRLCLPDRPVQQVEPSLKPEPLAEEGGLQRALMHIYYPFGKIVADHTADMVELTLCLLHKEAEIIVAADILAAG